MAKASLTYAFRPGEKTKHGFIRLLGKLSARAGRLTPRAREDLPEAIHEVRTLIKRTRFLLWFAKSVFGSMDFARIRKQLRNAAHLLAVQRDLTVTQSILKKFASKISNSRDQEVLASFSKTWIENAPAPARSENVLEDLLKKSDHHLLSAIDEMKRCASRSTAEWPSVKKRLAKTVHAAHKAGKKALRHGSDVEFHEWRKKTKRLLYNLELNEAKSGKREIKKADKLQERLGAYHDCVVVQEHLREKQPVTPLMPRLQDFLEKRKKQLRKKSHRLAPAI